MMVEALARLHEVCVDSAGNHRIEGAMGEAQ
jgi:hypothetical protein